MACILRDGTLVGAPFDLDFEHGHAAPSSTRFVNVIVAIERQRLAAPFQFGQNPFARRSSLAVAYTGTIRPNYSV